MTIDETLRGIYGCGCKEPATECGCWRYDDVCEEWTLRGCSVDGVPDWTVHFYRNAVIVDREISFYRQVGDAEDYAGAVTLARAMDAACRALQASLRAAEEAER